MVKSLLILPLLLIGCAANPSFLIKDNMSSDCVYLPNTTPKLGDVISWSDLNGHRQTFGTDYTVIKVADDNFDMAAERLRLDPNNCVNGITNNNGVFVSK